MRNVLVLSVMADLEYAVDYRDFAQGSQVQLLIMRLVSKGCQTLAQLVQGKDAGQCLGGLKCRRSIFSLAS